MKKILLFAIGIVGLANAGAQSYSVKLLSSAMLGATALAPGEYQVDVIEQRAVIRNGRIHCESPVKVESVESKYATTTVRFNNGDGKMHIQEIHVGGTKTKLVFDE
jgi:hypothetical protein